MTQYLNKYRSMSAPAKASLWFVICSVLQKGIAFLTTPLFTRVLSQEEYGTVSIYNSWLAVITILATFEF